MFAVRTFQIAATLALAVASAGCNSQFVPPPAPHYAFVSYPFQAGIAGPNAIAPGPVGSTTVWFGTSAPSTVGFVTTSGKITVFQGGMQPGLTPDPFGYFGITPGPDGNMWFSEAGNNSIARITPSGRVTETPAAGIAPFKIVPGPDGAMWYTLAGSIAIGRITTAPVPSAMSYPIPNPVPSHSANPQAIVQGDDRNLYFTDCGASGGGIDAVGQIVVDASGKPTFEGELATPTQGACPQGIVAGPDGNLWFLEANPKQSSAYNLARLVVNATFGSSQITEFPLGVSPGALAFLTATADGSLWIANNGPGAPGIIRASGLLSGLAAPALTSVNVGQSTVPIATAFDGSIWYGSPSTAGIGELTY